MSGYDQHEIGRRLRDIRVKYYRTEGSASGAEFADVLGESRYNLSNYERGTAGIPNRVLYSLAGLGFNLNWLITGNGSPIETPAQNVFPTANVPHDLNSMLASAVKAAAGDIAAALKSEV
ncbi:MAG: helix-turn-helix transcriptional regulator [Candidatus Kapabacteria bacterium]|nr:helix-turn-helix transcriptional regulator [Candidatus Kapabacteria bacterium]